MFPRRKKIKLQKPFRTGITNSSHGSVAYQSDCRYSFYSFLSTHQTGCRIKKKLFKDQKKIILEGINHKFFRDQKKITLHENSTGSVSLRSWPDQKKIIRPGSLAKYDMKNCTQFWPGAHSVKMYETHRNTPCSDHCVAGFSCC